MAGIKTYANQQKVLINKNENCSVYAQVDIDALQRAMQDLDGNAFKVWLYFAKNKAGYEFAVSPKAMEDWGIKKDSYYRGKKVLEEKGYLIEGKEGLLFKEVPEVKYIF